MQNIKKTPNSDNIKSTKPKYHMNQKQTNCIITCSRNGNINAPDQHTDKTQILLIKSVNTYGSCKGGLCFLHTASAFWFDPQRLYLPNDKT